MHDVAVGDDIFLALQPQLAGVAGAGFATERDAVGVSEIGVDEAGGFRQPVSPLRSCGSQSKISKTTPCKVAGRRQHGCALGNYLTRRANHRHSSIIAQSVKRTRARNGVRLSA
jgi:hypothetical protein